MRISRRMFLAAAILIVVVAGLAANTYLQPQQKQQLIISTTTSTFDTGLLNCLVPVFEKKHDCQVKILSKGTGESIEIARRGDVDVVLVHARDLEEVLSLMVMVYTGLESCSTISW